MTIDHNEGAFKQGDVCTSTMHILKIVIMIRGLQEDPNEKNCQLEYHNERVQVYREFCAENAHGFLWYIANRTAWDRPVCYNVVRVQTGTKGPQTL